MHEDDGSALTFARPECELLPAHGDLLLVHLLVPFRSEGHDTAPGMDKFAEGAATGVEGTVADG